MNLSTDRRLSLSNSEVRYENKECHFIILQNNLSNAFSDPPKSEELTTRRFCLLENCFYMNYTIRILVMPLKETRFNQKREKRLRYTYI